VADNQYDSITETFLGMDLYNLPMPVVPPIDLSIPFTEFVPRYLGPRETNTPVIGFNRLDKPQLRSLGIFSNLADGLVDGAGAFTGQGFVFAFYLDRLGPRLTGNIVNGAGTNTITTTLPAKFTWELSPGMTIVWLDDNKVQRSGVIDTITDDDNLILTAVTPSTGMYSASTTASFARPAVLIDLFPVTLRVPTLNTLFTRDVIIADVSKVRPINGISTFEVAIPQVGASSMNVRGVGTRYLRDVTVGQYVRVTSGGQPYTLIVQSVTSDVLMALTIPPAAKVPTIASYPAVTQVIDWVDDILATRLEVIRDFALYTISIDAAYGQANRRLSFHAVAEIEHSFVMTETLE
jgi:hypothetical protein